MLAKVAGGASPSPQQLQGTEHPSSPAHSIGMGRKKDLSSIQSSSRHQSDYLLSMPPEFPF